jgi:hypothetical protein
MKALSQRTNQLMEDTETQLRQSELNVRGTSCLQAIQVGARWRTNSTSDHIAAAGVIEATHHSDPRVVFYTSWRSGSWRRAA